MSTLCKACDFDNPPGMRFCGNCGTRLAEPDAPPQTVETSPGDLGVMMGADLIARFRAAGLQAAGQRRNVTVLFVDLTDYTGLSELIDSEDLYEIVQEFINMLVAAVYKYDGMVDKIVGDGLMALFGAPIGHENNAELAIRSALDMQSGLKVINEKFHERLGQNLQMHIGLHSGTVIVGGMGSNMLMDYTAIGDTVNLAHRLEEAADPGVILVSESVYRQTRMLFDYTELPDLSLKGIQRKVTGHKVEGSKVRPGRVRGVEGLSSPMVGRELELAQLSDAVYRAIDRQQIGFAMVFGEAGIGKSRLLLELRTQLQTKNIAIFEGQSLTYRRSVAYWIFLDLMRNYLGISANAPEAQVRARLSERVEHALGNSAADSIPFLEHLLSLKPSNPSVATRINQLDADQLQQQIFIAVRDLFIAESKKQPVLLILDDLHWADDASLELLRFLLTTGLSSTLFICGISRPVEAEMLQKTVERAKNRLTDRYLQIQLQSLPQEKSEQLLNQLLTIPDFPKELREKIVQSASGVPFYLEEILRMLIDEAIIYLDGVHWRLYPGADISTLGVPDNLQALILARFDRLDQQQRRILQVAAVIGREFSVALVESILPGLSGSWIEDQLQHLTRRGFIVPQMVSHQADYAFRHALTSDAIYSTLLRRDRGELHGQVGAAIEKIYGDRLNEYIYLLARHYSWSPRLDQALHYSILAGQKSARDFLNVQAREYFEQALGLLDQVDHSPSQALDVYFGIGDALVFNGEYENARQKYRSGHEFVDKNDPKQTKSFVELQRKIGKTFERQGEYEQALNSFNDAYQRLNDFQAELKVERAEVWNDIGWIHFRRGDFEQAGEIFQRALDIVSDSDAYGVIASINNRLGGVAYFLGDWDQAAKYLRSSIAIRESIGDVAGLASSSNNLGNLEIEMGLYDEALDDLTRNFELVQRLGQVEAIAVAHNNLGWLYILRGETQEARKSLNAALELARQIGYSSLIREVRKNLGEYYMAIEQWEQAREILVEVRSAFEELGANDQLMNVTRLLGETALGQGDLEDAQTWVNELDSLVVGGMTLPALQQGEVFRFKGMVAIRLQSWERAQQFLNQSLQIFRDLKSRLNVGRTLYQMGRLAYAQNEISQAKANYQEAFQIFNQIGACLDAQRTEKAQNLLD